MDQLFRNHRKYQILEWIRGLEGGYGQTNEAPPTASNLAYYLIADGDYRKETLDDKFGRHARRGTPDSNVFKFVKRDLTRHLHQYSPELFCERRVTKRSTNHASLDTGIETKAAKATAYCLSERGTQQLDQLRRDIKFKRQLITSYEETSYQKGNVRWISEEYDLDPEYVDRINNIDDEDDLETDSIAVPVERRLKTTDWKIERYVLPRIKVIDHDPDGVPTIHRNP